MGDTRIGEEKPLMEHNPRVELSRLVIALIVAVAVTLIWLGAIVRPDQITETRAELWQALLGVVLIIMDILLFGYAIYAARRLRQRSDAVPSARRNVAVTDNTMHMEGGDHSTLIQSKGSVTQVHGTLINNTNTISASVMMWLIGGIALAAVAGLILAVVLLILDGRDISITNQPASLSAQDTSSITETPSPPVVAAVVPRETSLASLVPDTPTETATVSASVSSTPDIAPEENRSSNENATPTVDVALSTTPTDDQQPLTATSTITIDFQATRVALAKLNATSTAFAAVNSPSPPVNTLPPPTFTPSPERPTQIPTLPVRTYPAPQLLSPADGTVFESGQSATLVWNGVGELTTGDHYLLVVEHAGGTEWRVTDSPSWELPSWMVCNSLPQGCGWWVVVVRNAEVGGYGEKTGTEVSEHSVTWRFNRAPSGSGSGSSPPPVITPDQ